MQKDLLKYYLLKSQQYQNIPRIIQNVFPNERVDAGSSPNIYLHFGDFDLAGIDIFLSQFPPAVGDRGSFLIPNDIETRIPRGSRHRYDEQYSRYSNLTTADPDLDRLIDIIHRHRRAYDQEGYIEQYK